MKSRSIIHTHALAYAYDSDNRWEFEDIALQPGERLLILGQSGSGKTTLLHLLSGLLSPSAGEVWVAGQSLTTLSKSAVDNLRGSKIGMVFQRPHFLRSLNVQDNIMMANKIGSNDALTDLKPILKSLGIGQLARKKIHKLSEGEKQRVGIARALANRPSVILADEPTSALDDHNCQAVISLLIDASEQMNCALIVVTHDARIKDHFPNRLTIGKS